MLVSKTMMATVAMVLGAAGCSLGSSSAKSSTCYDDLIAAAQSCAPPPMGLGVMNDAGTACTYAGGDQVTFAPPESDGVSNFVLDSPGGSLCMSYLSADGGFTLQTSAGTATRSSTGAVTCPNGVEYSGTTPAGNISAYGSGTATFTLVTADGGLALFNCAAN